MVDAVPVDGEVDADGGVDTDRAVRGRPKDVDSAETRARVLSAARRTFAAKGYAATTNRDIAKAAGLTAAALYHYADSKAGLYAAVYDDAQDRVYSEFERAVVEAGPGLRPRLCAVLDSAVALNRSDVTLSGFLNVVAVDLRRHGELAELVADARLRSRSFVKRLVREAAEDGELTEGLGLQAAEDCCTVLLSGLARLSNLTGDADRHAAAVAATKHLINGTLIA